MIRPRRVGRCEISLDIGSPPFRCWNHVKSWTDLPSLQTLSPTNRKKSGRRIGPAHPDPPNWFSKTHKPHADCRTITSEKNRNAPMPNQSLPAFAQKFADVWRTPTLDSLTRLLAEDVQLIQPLSAPINGKTQVRRAFRRILFRFTGIRGEVRQGFDHGTTQLVDWTMIVPVGRKEYEIPVIDLFTLNEDGLVQKRIAYFDPTPLQGPILRSPRIWARTLISNFFK